MKQNKDLDDVMDDLKKLGLPKEFNDLLVILFERCYLKGMLRGSREAQKRMTDLVDHFRKE